MKIWYLIDDCTTKKGAVYSEKMDAGTREEAKGVLEEAWSALTSFDKKQRDAYYAVYAEDNGSEPGRNEAQIDFESITDEVRL